MITKKDLWWVLSSRETETTGEGGFVAGAGVLREEGREESRGGATGEERGLLERDRGEGGHRRTDTLDTLDSIT